MLYDCGSLKLYNTNNLKLEKCRQWERIWWKFSGLEGDSYVNTAS